MIFIHGNKSLVSISLVLFIVFSFLCACRLSESKLKLIKNLKIHNMVISELEESNKRILEEISI